MSYCMESPRINACSLPLSKELNWINKVPSSTLRETLNLIKNEHHNVMFKGLIKPEPQHWEENGRNQVFMMTQTFPFTEWLTKQRQHILLTEFCTQGVSHCERMDSEI